MFGATNEDLLLEMAVKSAEKGRKRRQKALGQAVASGNVHQALLHMQTAPMEEAKENNLLDLMFKYATGKTKRAGEILKGGG